MGEFRTLLVLLLACSMSNAYLMFGATRFSARGMGHLAMKLSGGKLEEETELTSEETVEKYGLEAGVYKAMMSEGGGQAGGKVGPGELLKKYGVAYLVTSITLATMSYGLCYVLIDNGVDVNELLDKVGIKTTQGASTAGTAALAYAVHKAASPIRFPPTVALTPMVASWMGREPNEEQ